ncbi:DegT/DnrJ/EryC1/StrS family aminotransferase [Desulfosarcina ovata]|uniref:8-amino-3,8-dideoxy-alpha-D-manno-octulosonate transaminase n=1 Tax=Desulfosarcina ovata subsp. ovata TaxID=2752305 RepID=A0A5K8AA19_9BACT|nr:DegT/DnrJ/EryC1/StrS family aminotransferase [Desulfosarcina ovata]BBO89346.1 8-amino-3,8-dideoxy-alpha-D-manno-octulosonate transaminase [Desulfosarcina ovata subsp. ovata]
MPGFEIFGDEERKEVNDVLETGVLFRYGFDAARKEHWKARSFETELAARLGVKHAHLCASGTAALSTALAACGIGAGDEVIVPPFTFVATIESVLMAGAVPVFAEVDDTLCLSPEAVAAALTPNTRAVVPVHMCGAMARIDELKTLCDRKGLVLLEDACQSVGASYQGKALGSFGKAGCFSFDPVKTITCGEGGAVVTDDAAVYAATHAFADHGHDHIGSDRGAEDHLMVGSNFRISELNAAVGLAQLRKLDWILETQRRNKAAIKTAMQAIDGVTFRALPDPEGDSATFLTFFMPDLDKARQAAAALGTAGVDGCFHWFDNNWHYIRKWEHFHTLKAAARLAVQALPNCPDFSDVRLPQSDGLIGRAISMQIKLGWNADQLAQRIEATVEALKGI